VPGNPDSHVDRTYGQTVNVRRSPERRTFIPSRSLADARENARDQWTHRLDIGSLSRSTRGANPLGQDFDYAAAFLAIDLDELAGDIDQVLTTSQEWWPADFGHYGPLILRMAWHTAGTYRARDGRGGASAGMQRFAPLIGWPDNRNLDKARRLLWPVKQKYGHHISWADLMIFAGNRALETMGFPTLGFGGGREEVWAPDETYWGPESTWLADERHSGVRDLDEPLAASEMGLIYVDPQGPATVPDPIASAREIRQTFLRMGLDDVETVALLAGGHTFGKSHGAADPNKHLGPEPDVTPPEQQGLGWKNSYGTGNGPDTITTGLEGIWTPTPTVWDNSFLETLFAYEWDVTLSPAGLWQWIPSGGNGEGTVPDPFDPSKTHAPTMLTTDIALQHDPAYEVIARRFLEHPSELAAAFALAWFKLTHIDMGPRQRYLGTLVPSDRLLWQDPLPEADHLQIDSDDIAALKTLLLESGLTTAQLVSTAWASASTFRNSDKRGGANGARIRLEPQRNWAVNEPGKLAVVLAVLERIRTDFNALQHNDEQGGDKQVSLADLIVLGGCVGVEAAAAEAGHRIQVPFHPGRTDAAQEWTDPERFAALEPTADAFRSYAGIDHRMPPDVQLIERAGLLTLSAPEMTVLLGGLRVLGVTHGGRSTGVLTSRPGALTNDYFVNLLDAETSWTKRNGETASEAVYDGRDRRTDTFKWEAGFVDLAFANNSELRAISEVYASPAAGSRFVHDFVSAWSRVMNLDRFDLQRAIRRDP